MKDKSQKMDKKKCTCCGKDTIPADSFFEICAVCGWQDDEIQNESPDYAGGANAMSLNDARKHFYDSRKVL